MKTTPIEFRRHLHRHPELSFEEHKTAQYISERLTQIGIEHRPIAGSGILAKIEGRGDLSHAVVLRADIDALPIQEQSQMEWASCNVGVMHACGHDVHAAVLFGVLSELSAERNFEGTIFGLFQPGEECNPGGASLVLAEEPFKEYNIKAVIGEHVEPQLPVGAFGFKSGKYMASSDELRLYVRGKGGHGAMREQVIDPVGSASQTICGLLKLNSEECVLSIGKLTGEGATNVIPNEVYMEGTLRTFDEGIREAVKTKIRECALTSDAHWQTTTEVDINKGYPCVTNDEKLTSKAVALAQELGVEHKMLPLRTTAEDFGFYTQLYPSLFYRLGIGEESGRAHTSTFSPDERAIEHGINFMKQLALRLANGN